MFRGDFTQSTQIGPVSYVDFGSYDLPIHIANDAGHRAFLKHEVFSHEREVRIAALNIVHPGCLNPDG